MKKRIISIILVLAMVLSLLQVMNLGVVAETFEIWDGTTDTGFAGGDGTEETPYLISNGKQLAYFANQVNTIENYSKDKYFKLTTDIYLNNTENWKEDLEILKKWTPIGTYTNQFVGTFDGDGHAVYGVYTTDSSIVEGLFGISNGKIKNLGVKESFIFGGENTAAVCGKLCKNGEIVNCYNTGIVNETGSFIGGICSWNEGKIENCYNTGTITGTDYVGGICGYNKNSIINCYNAGIVTGTSCFVGSISGENEETEATITNCYYLADSANDGTTTQNGIGNKTAGSTTADNEGKTTSCTAENMKLSTGDEALVTLLNSVMPEGELIWNACESINNGYPILTKDTRADISTAWTVSTIEAQTYNSFAQCPDVEVKAGTATLTKDEDYTVSYSNNINAGTATVTITPSDSGNYKGTKTVTFTINPVSLTYTSGSYTKKYDGTALTNSTVTLTSGALAGTDEVTITVTGTQTDAGTSANLFTVEAKPGTNLGNYNITKVEGTLTVTKRDVTLTSATDRKVYDNTPLTNHTVTVGGDGFVSREGVTCTVTGKLTDAGSVDNTFTYSFKSGTKDSNYEIKTTNGTLTVNKKSLEDSDILFSAEQISDGTLKCTVLDKFIGKDIIKSVQITYTTRDGKPVSVLTHGESCIVTITANSKSNYEGRKSIEVTGTIFTPCKCLDGTTITDSQDVNSGSTNVNGKDAKGGSVVTKIQAVDIKNAVGGKINVNAKNCTEEVGVAVYAAYGNKVVDFIGVNINITDGAGNAIAGALSYPVQLHFTTSLISDNYKYVVALVDNGELTEYDSIVYKNEGGTNTVEATVNHFSKYVLVKLTADGSDYNTYPWKLYKDSLIEKLDAVKEDYDNIIANAKTEILDFSYVDVLSLEENEENIDKILQQAMKDLNKARLEYAKKASAKLKEEVDNIPEEGNGSRLIRIMRLIGARTNRTISYGWNRIVALFKNVFFA